MCFWGPIPIKLRCDGQNNCGDNADEEDCEKGKKIPCTINVFYIGILFTYLLSS